jgi:hypothetical protein
MKNDTQNTSTTNAPKAPFEAPKLARHEKLPVITAGSGTFGSFF